MPGKLGDDFNPADPADSSLVKLGAQWIRDIKWRLKQFASVLFNLETGDFKDNVVRSASLIDSGVTPGTYNRVRVSSKGLVEEGFDEDVQQTGVLHRGRFEAAGAVVDTVAGSDALTGSGGTYTGSGAPYTGTYSVLNGATYVAYQWVVPENVRRVRVSLTGGGGGPSTEASGVTVFSAAASGATTLTGNWAWVSVTPGWTYPTATEPVFASSWRIKSTSLDAAETLSFDDGVGGGLLDTLLPGVLIKNQRTNEIVRIVSYQSGFAWTVERAQRGSSPAAILDNDQWDVLLRYGGGGAEYVEGTLPVTPGETLSVVVGEAGGEAQDGAPSAVASGSGYIEAGGGQAGATGTGGGVTTGAKSSNLGTFSAPGSPGSLTVGGRSGSHFRSADGFFGDGGGHSGSQGLDGMVLIEWIV
jgi:hypothetical protein